MKNSMGIALLLTMGLLTTPASAFDIVFKSAKTPYATVHLKNGKTIKIHRNKSKRGVTTYTKKNGRKISTPTRFTRLSYRATSIEKICCGVRCKKPKPRDRNWICR